MSADKRPTTTASSSAAVASQVRFRTNVASIPRAPLGRPVWVTAVSGEIKSVTLVSADQPSRPVKGTVSTDQHRWSAAGLAPDTRYRLTVQGKDANGRQRQISRTFRTKKLSKDEQTYPSFVPTDGATVGIAMPVIVHFDVAVTDRATMEKHLRVSSSPAQPGSFHWMSDREVHWRPASYWQPGTKVTVTADVGGVPAGNGIYGQLDRTMRFTVGRAQAVRVNAASHRMRVVRDGKRIRDFPITTGKAGFITRSGTKVIMEKFPQRRMNSETVGIRQGSAEAYDISDVKWAMRITNSGEFIHAAPWSVGSQGRANVSHGCTGMSVTDASWLYAHTLIGDPVEYTGTDRSMTLTNGWGDWNLDFAAYRSGSAL